MRQSGERSCDFCGTQAMSNVAIEGRRTVEYCDGPPGATVPSIVLCYECAEEVTAYFDARRTAEPESGALASFSEDDVNALLERVRESPELVLETDAGHGYGIRYVDGEWKRAVTRPPGPPTLDALTERDVEDVLCDANSLTLKALDADAWDRFASDPRSH